MYVIATHTHADHITACFSLQAMYDCDYVMSTETASLGVTMHVDDEEKIMLGSIPIQFHAAPGHTNDSMIVHVPGYMMTGDFLFNGKEALVETTCPAVESTFTGVRSRCSLGLKAQPSFALATTARNRNDVVGLES